MSDDQFRHDAAVYASDEEFLAMALPFVAAGSNSANPCWSPPPRPTWN
ncbi:hypothetical protein [Saccharothrix violaceirubra]|uniref:Uncharacterized protein n=1 Tax=Saccharothrix violaceirubra TaxID=413306 RepID=A0A7W7T1M4_9PSEU|nr:hypothetical protein [Saccharothrix violaceirubra]MBB4964884.1 hypothetical protein [Saccharothrix violaceirubra]